MERWQIDLRSAAAGSLVRFDTASCVGNKAHGHVAAALLRAFEHDDAAHLYAEPRVPGRRSTQNAKPADLLLLHPRLGALFVEVKAWSLHFIRDVDAGTFLLKTGDAKNPWQQVASAAAQLQKATRRVLRERSLSEHECPYFEWVVALPSISRDQWHASPFATSIADCELLLADDLLNAPALRDRLLRHLRAKAAKHLPCATAQLDHVREALGASYVIRSRTAPQEPAPPAGTLGAQLHAARQRSHMLSDEQIDMIETEFDGRPQLIRGVAGSGKTVVLVRNCARLVHRLESATANLFAESAAPPRVAMVCYNRVLTPYLQTHFDEAYRAFTGKNQPLAQVDICNFNSLMWRIGKVHRPWRYNSWKGCDPADRGIGPRFAADYLRQLEQLAAERPEVLKALQYDAMYVDEGQDLYNDEFRVLMHLLKVNATTGTRNIVIAYDDAQNLYGRPRPTWTELGIQVSGGRAYAMKLCHRNPREIVEFAFNVLLGAQADKRAGTRTFADTAYLKEQELVTELPDRWQVNFAATSVPVPPRVQLFATRSLETEWVVSQVLSLLKTEHVSPEDIALLFHSDVGAYRFAHLASALRSRMPHLLVHQPYGKRRPRSLAADGEDVPLVQARHLTISTVQSAKGYDAPVVFLMGADLFGTGTEDRAAFYVGATRARTRLAVTGLRVENSLAAEADRVLSTLSQPAAPAPQVVSGQNNPAPHEKVRTFRRGERVCHPTHGVGTVVEDGSGKTLPAAEGANQYLLVQFVTGIRQMTGDLSRLTLV